MAKKKIINITIAEFDPITGETIQEITLPFGGGESRAMLAVNGFWDGCYESDRPIGYYVAFDGRVIYNGVYGKR